MVPAKKCRTGFGDRPDGEAGDSTAKDTEEE